MKPLLTANENARLDLLHRLQILDTAEEAVYDSLTELACLLCNCSNAALTLISEHHQWVKAFHGYAVSSMPREQAYCAHTILTPHTVTYVPDALADSRFADNPLAHGSMRSYTGVALCPEEGLAVGALCVYDEQPKTLTPKQLQGLQLLAKQATELLQARLTQTSLREQSAQLIQERNRLEAIVRGTNLGTWEWHIDTGATSFNGRWYDILGLDPTIPASIDTWRQRLHPDDVLSTQTELERHFRKETEFYDAKFRMRHDQGHWIWIQAVGRVMTWTDSGSPLLMFGTHRDISARIRT